MTDPYLHPTAKDLILHLPGLYNLSTVETEEQMAELFGPFLRALRPLVEQKLIGEFSPVVKRWREAGCPIYQQETEDREERLELIRKTL